MRDSALRAVAYIRVDEAGEPDTASQRAAIEAWALRESVTVASWHVDRGVSGGTPIAERPGLVSAYRALREERASILVADTARRFAEDRLVSWLIEQAALVERVTVRTADGDVAAAADPRGDADEAWTRGAVDLARAYHRVVTRARVRAALADKRARGERIGTIPYGYRLASDRVHIEPDAAEQSVVSIVRALAERGLSQRAIVAELGARGVSGRTGAPLRQTQVAKILRSA